jgi:hypothetical protein
MERHSDFAATIRGFLYKIEHFSSADCRIINGHDGRRPFSNKYPAQDRAGTAT